MDWGELLTRGVAEVIVRAELEERIVKLRTELNHRKQLREARTEIAPRIRFVLDSYPLADTAEKKNELLKSVLEKVVYNKSQRIRWGEGGGDMKISILPKLPH